MGEGGRRLSGARQHGPGQVPVQEHPVRPGPGGESPPLLLRQDMDLAVFRAYLETALGGSGLRPGALTAAEVLEALFTGPES